MAMRELVDPEGLGGFKVLIQEAGHLHDIDGLFPSHEHMEQSPMPLLQSDHLPQYDGGYPSEMWEFEASPMNE
jgi:hypothetical protein